MPTLEEVAGRVNFLMEQGGHDRKCHFGLVDVEAKERAANPKGRTRLIKELGSPEAYGEWNAEFDRYYQAAGNPIIAQSIMLRLLKQLSTDSITALAKDEPAGRV
jgi:hypothetical protein